MTIAINSFGWVLAFALAVMLAFAHSENDLLRKTVDRLSRPHKIRLVACECGGFDMDCSCEGEMLCGGNRNGLTEISSFDAHAGTESGDHESYGVPGFYGPG